MTSPDRAAPGGQPTPGPWQALQDEYGDWRVEDSAGKDICNLGVLVDPQTEPDARLIAAAPDLLAALEAITDHFAAVMEGPIAKAGGITFENGVEGIPTIAQARAALARARSGGGA
jgi:hypothetical protein